MFAAVTADNVQELGAVAAATERRGGVVDRDGVEAGLGEDGGSDCPTTIREYLVDYLSREFAPGSSGDRRPKISPERMIDSLDTSVVAVHGLVPAGAPPKRHC